MRHASQDKVQQYCCVIGSNSTAFIVSRLQRQSRCRHSRPILFNGSAASHFITCFTKGACSQAEACGFAHPTLTKQQRPCHGRQELNDRQSCVRYGGSEQPRRRTVRPADNDHRRHAPLLRARGVRRPVPPASLRALGPSLSA